MRSWPGSADVVKCSLSRFMTALYLIFSHVPRVFLDLISLFLLLVSGKIFKISIGLTLLDGVQPIRLTLSAALLGMRA